MTHTKESLEAMGPRELDALAHETVMRERVMWRICEHWDGWEEIESDKPIDWVLRVIEEIGPRSRYVRQPCTIRLSVHYDYDAETDTLLEDGIHRWYTDFNVIPNYSASLDAAAVLEAEIKKRELDEDYAAVLFDATFPTHLGDIYEHRLTPLITATAKARTVAAILAVQEAA